MLLAAVFAALGIQLVVGVSGASAHWWWPWEWQRAGSAVYIYTYNYAGPTFSAADAARRDIYYRPHPVYLPAVNYHTDISIFDAYEPSANFCGLAQIIDYYYASGKWWIRHGHAHHNTACGTGGPGTYVQGVHCQEIAHTLGLDHSDTGDCMGLGYYPGSSGRYCFDYTGCNSNWGHQAYDLYNLYRY